MRNDRRMGGAEQRRKMTLEYCVISPVTLTSHFPAAATNCPRACGTLFVKVLAVENWLSWAEWCVKSDCDGKDGETEFPSSDFGISHPLTEFFFSCSQLQEVDSVYGCSQCKGSGCAPCSLCHGSKFSMLANRFRESYRALRCPACAETGLQPCRVCAA